jgi:hypothetical protein
VDFFIIGFPNPVFTDHRANLSVHPDSEINEDKINPPHFHTLFVIIIHDFSRVNIFFTFFVGQHFFQRTASEIYIDIFSFPSVPKPGLGNEKKDFYPECKNANLIGVTQLHDF